ncbi:MAG: penicillin-binding transpeptidase domain-containing protein [Bryobacteraceae bacterium]|jgi:cell division protein FtsI/penicillin-binding protein 2
MALALVAGVASGATAHRKTTKTASTIKVKKRTGISRKATPAALTRRTARRSRIRRLFGPWTAPTYADSTNGDRVDGEDPIIRRAAVEALGPYNGTVVSVDPGTGRILSMVNQRVALRSGFQPCSTVKIPVALAALSEGIIDRATPIRLYGRTRMDLTQALAHSNNVYFASLGLKLGYDRFSYYARLFGLGEKAGLNIEGEEPGYFADAPPKGGGMGMMTSFGEGITLTPLELAALLSAVANGGTLYYLQYPRNSEEAEQFLPRVKRYLDIAQYVPQIKPGLMGAVEFGTARRAVYDPEAPVCGKTGTCTGGTTHLGWFGSFSDFGRNKLVVVVLLTGGPGVSGPTAAGISGNIYRKLQQDGYFVRRPVISPAVLVSR